MPTSKGSKEVVFYFTPDFPPQRNAPGLRAAYHCAALAKQGFKVRVLTSRSQNDRHAQADIEIFDLGDSPTGVQKNTVRIFRELLIGFRGAAILKRLTPQMLIISSPPFFSSILLACAARLMRVPYCVDVRDRYPEVFFSLGIIKKKSFVGYLFLRLEAGLYKNARMVTVATSGISDSICKEVRGVTCEVVPNGFVRSLMPADKKTDAGCVSILTHGTFGRFFNEEVFEEIGNRIQGRLDSKVKIIAVGSGPKLDSLKRKGLDWLETKSWMRQRDLEYLLSRVQIGLSVHTSDESMLNAFPVKIYDYLGAGLPTVIIPRNLAGQEVQSVGAGRAFATDQIEDAVDLIVAWVCNPALRNDASDAARRLRGKYSRIEISKRFAEKINECVHGAK